MKISVIVPIYKAEKYLHQCVDSILDQTYRDIELILVDDGSPDGCPMICDEYAKKDNRVRVIHKENGGVSCAVKEGLRIANGEYLFFVDSDDWIELNALEVCLTAARQMQCDMVVGHYVLEHRGKVIPCNMCSGFTGLFQMEQIKERFYPGLIQDATIGRYSIEMFRWMKLIRSNVILPHLDDIREDMNLWEDLYMNFLMMIHCNSIYILEDAYLYHYRYVAGSVSHDANKDRYFELCEVHRKISTYVKEKSNYDFSDQLDRLMLYIILIGIAALGRNPVEALRNRHEVCSTIRQICQTQALQGVDFKGLKGNSFSYRAMLSWARNKRVGLIYVCTVLRGIPLIWSRR